MAHKEPLEPFEQPLSSVRPKEEPSPAPAPPPVAPKLTMKWLYELIADLQKQNSQLAKRIADLEQELEPLQQLSREAATAAEAQEHEKQPPAVPEAEAKPESSEIKLIPRSIRHPKKKKSPLLGLLSHLVSLRPL